MPMIGFTAMSGETRDFRLGCSELTQGGEQLIAGRRQAHRWLGMMVLETLASSISLIALRAVR